MESIELPTRRSQASRRASSHALILDAAVELLVERGYSGTTTVAIQQRAGVTRGRLLHHFSSRDALLVAAAQHLADEQITAMELWFKDLDDSGPGGGARVDRAIAWLWDTFRQPYFWAAMELWLAARTDVALRNELAGAERRLGQAIQHVIATMFGPVHSSHPQFDDVRTLLFTSMRGVAFTYSIAARDPETERHLTLWRTTARQMLGVPPDDD
jgi:AcrR family transcriptional regulator